ncbi:M1-specific T cell receptor beta chain-like isoform X2 [Puntigrus tetrazona]|uniref:M1-specific T cell receptor beta chain-like isoform X2 n=1 Tax=Puntigrus tetrazona TaxID=1606681 RepID=UPI001C8A63BC|nr:M1-specific T cell receptor beta chain-like isoform X2 [Puntigrus tetrazona]
MCAVSTTAQAHFGEGTKLTVLDSTVKVTSPKVTILNETSCKEKATLVCLVKDFYPDHVSIKWTHGGEEILTDVATDPYAIQNDTTKLYSMSSRLKVYKKEFTPKNTYKCEVTFYKEESKHVDIQAEITGTRVAGGEFEPDKFLKSSKRLSLAYGVFIAKSALYGLVILVFVLRKGSSGK